MKLIISILCLLLVISCERRRYEDIRGMTAKEIAVDNANCNLLGLTGRVWYTDSNDVYRVTCVPPTIVYVPNRE